MMADILKFTDTTIINKSFEEYEYHEYEPITGTSLNNGGDIRISIESQDILTHPSEGYFIFEGRLTKADSTLYINADEVALTNNAIMHLFSRIEYHLSNQLIESLNYPGQATTMLGLQTYPDYFSTAQRLNQLWYKCTVTTAAKADNNGFAARHAYLIQPATVKGTLSFRIPMKHIFGFCEDYGKIVYVLKHNLTLVRKTDDDAIFRLVAVASAEKVSLDKISWLIPHVIPADAEKFSIYKTIESKVKVPVAYRTRQCDVLLCPESTSFTGRRRVKTSPEKRIFIIVGFQTAKDGDQTKNPFTYDHVHLRNAYVMLNADRYPTVAYNLSLSNQTFSRVYGDAALFGVKFFGMDELITQSNITPRDYKTLYSLFTFDVSKQKEKIKSSVVNIQIKANFTENVPANTRAFALVISDMMLSFQSDGNIIAVIYYKLYYEYVYEYVSRFN